MVESARGLSMPSSVPTAIASPPTSMPIIRSTPSFLEASSRYFAIFSAPTVASIRRVRVPKTFDMPDSAKSTPVLVFVSLLQYQTPSFIFSLLTIKFFITVVYSPPGLEIEVIENLAKLWKPSKHQNCFKLTSL